MSQLKSTPKQTEQSFPTPGRLKIFFGYAAGVGKTYAMLQAAQHAKKNNIDVVIGYIRPHIEQEIQLLLKEFPVIPTLSIPYKDTLLQEFDLDFAIQRKPKLILIDELAHTNAKGCRHTKRYQDIEELLNAGIDVYTTVNVAHFESLNHSISSITGVITQEQIPDLIFDNAEEVEFVDMEPKELIKRLHTDQRVPEKFFDIKNLTALREIAFQKYTERIHKISKKSQLPQREENTMKEHILVCLSPFPANHKTICTAARMATAFQGNFTALFVETSDFSVMREEDKKCLQNNIYLAKQLGATIETLYGNDIAYQIAEFARLSGISKIVIGRSSVHRKYIWSKPTLTEKLIQHAPNLDIYIIPDGAISGYRLKKASLSKKNTILFDIAKSILLLILSTLIGFLFRYLGFSESNIIIVYILGVLIIAAVTSPRIYSLVSSVISVLAFNYFFTYPYFSLKAYDEGYPITFLIMFLSAFITSTLAVRMKREMKQASQRAYRTKILLETNQLIQKGKTKSEVLSITANQIVKLLRRNLILYPVHNGTLGKPITYTTDNTEIPIQYLSQNEREVAVWVYKNNKHAGAFTNTLSNAKCFYLAIRINDTIYGVIGIVMSTKPLDTLENSILLSILGECALSLEKEDAIQQREHAALIAKNEQLRSNLLRSISHDLRTPLTSISGNAGILLANEQDLNETRRKQLYTNIYDDSLWLIDLVENLLSITRIEDGTMKLRTTAELIEEIITEALQHINRKSVEHQIVVYPIHEFILVKVDARLIIQVIINIVNNAIKYTPKGSKISISVTKINKQVVVEIADNGEGIPDESKEQIFKMFYIVNKGTADNHRNLGLGLALCKSIITAHGGEITVLDNQPKGTIFRFTLPTEEVTLHE